VRLHPWIKLYLAQITAVFIWLGVIALLFALLYRREMTPVEALARAEHFMAFYWYGPVIFFVLFILRPFTLIPGIVFVALGGRIFDMWPGIVYGLLAMTLSAILPYYVGTLFAREGKRPDELGKVRQMGQRIARIMRGNPYEALIALRMVNLAYDVTSFTAGNLRTDFRVFMRATLLGNVFIVYAFTSLGASLEGDLRTGDLRVEPTLVISSLLVLAASVTLSRILRRRMQAQRQKRQQRATEAARHDRPAYGESRES
jgi:uncharacterized membrane protein YdjX (TVP38/TMEM64 family)